MLGLVTHNLVYAVPQINPTAYEKLEKIRSGAIPYPPMWQTVPVQLVDFSPGKIIMTTRAHERHLNAFGGVHGGFVAAALDTALGLTVFISLDNPAAVHTTVDLAVKIVKRIPVGTELTIETELVNISRRLGVSQGVIRDEAGAVYAHGTTSCMIKQPD